MKEDDYEHEVVVDVMRYAASLGALPDEIEKRDLARAREVEALSWGRRAKG